jgi:hypothetical protein
MCRSARRSTGAEQPARGVPSPGRVEQAAGKAGREGEGGKLAVRGSAGLVPQVINGRPLDTSCKCVPVISTPRISMVPMMNAAPLDRPVMTRL